MDAKYLAEIEARCDEGRPTARIDVKALIAEVERLTDLSRQNYCKFVRQQEECDAKDQQIATLKKALELACYELAEALGKSAYQPAVRTLAGGYYNDFIHQAQGQEGKK